MCKNNRVSKVFLNYKNTKKNFLLDAQSKGSSGEELRKLVGTGFYYLRNYAEDPSRLSIKQARKVSKLLGLSLFEFLKYYCNEK